MASRARHPITVLALWILLAFFLPLGAQLAADTLAPMPAAVTNEVGIEAAVRHERVKQAVSYVSPMALYSDATSVILDPFRKTTRSLVLMGPLERLSLSRFENPLPLDASALVVAPHLVLLVALTFLCFGLTYATFSATGGPGDLNARNQAATHRTGARQRSRRRRARRTRHSDQTASRLDDIALRPGGGLPVRCSSSPTSYRAWLR